MSNKITVAFMRDLEKQVHKEEISYSRMVELLNEAAKPKPLGLIDALRNSDHYIETIFMQGSCYRFHLFLKSIYPQAIPCINNDGDHIITLIDGEFYDINGFADERVFRKMDALDIKKVEHWSFAMHNALRIKECPSCGEDICYGDKPYSKEPEPTDKSQIEITYDISKEE